MQHDLNDLHDPLCTIPPEMERPFVPTGTKQGHLGHVPREMAIVRSCWVMLLPCYISELSKSVGGKL